MVTGSGAFDAVVADRSAVVAVASDADALLGLTPHGAPTGAFAYVEADELVLDVSGTNPNVDAETGPTYGATGVNTRAITRVDDAFNVSNQGTVVVELVCGAAATEQWRVDVVTEGPGVAVEFSRTLSITCTTGNRRGGPPADADTTSAEGVETPGSTPPDSTPTPAETVSTVETTADDATPTPIPTPSATGTETETQTSTTTRAPGRLAGTEDSR